MTLQQFLLAELDREVARSRRALEHVPDGKYQWKPHDRSMIFGYLADMVATIPSWIAMEITLNELDIGLGSTLSVLSTLYQSGSAGPTFLGSIDVFWLTIGFRAGRRQHLVQRLHA